MSVPACTVPLLEVQDLSVEFRTRGGLVRAVEHVSFQVARGETVGVVGESGSGKSVTALALLRILDPSARITSGRAVFGGLDLLAASEAELALQRGREISMIFQNPRTALNPIRPVGRQIGDVLLRHANVTRADVRRRAVELLARVQIPDPERRYAAYPFELSGGMCQRVMIALALACSPALLIADEPTTGLDVTTQATIMDLIRELAGRTRMATILITHDLALAAEHADRIVVMHAGHVVESAPTAALFANPRHPYTAKLIAATPQAAGGLEELAAIPGGLPDLTGELPPCRYHARCERYAPICDGPLPRAEVLPGHVVACAKPI
ncbi:MAG TPA: ABC transporter ATP-binding protein [Methylomirabilota bacterium]|nr:ABC transporter ATP-binding protein [Methylomirabilota bacterium]